MLISAVATVLGLRAYLEVTGYPQIGGNGLHIAHMLWGGLLMLVAIVLLQSFVGIRAQGLAALSAGIGFGLFIDELGKFITSDNDYFFQPTIGLLYVIFVVLFLVFRALDVRRPLRAVEALANATDALADLVISGATPGARARVLRPLQNSDAAGPFASALHALVDAAPDVAEQAPSLPARAAGRARSWSARALSTAWFARTIVALFLVSAVFEILTVAAVAVVLIAASQDLGQTAVVREMSANPPPNGWVATLISGAAALVSLVFTLIGAARFRASRLSALRWFERSVIVSLLLVDPINFFALEFEALTGLVFDLILWAGVSYLIRQETISTSLAGGPDGQD
ncbi:MAG: hypothetical protein JO352_06770 [Chloroflexi bacterium]|nr:hypothetical protein [Chloroflexota bacterium]